MMSELTQELDALFLAVTIKQGFPNVGTTKAVCQYLADNPEHIYAALRASYEMGAMDALEDVKKSADKVDGKYRHRCAMWLEQFDNGSDDVASKVVRGK